MEYFSSSNASSETAKERTLCCVCGGIVSPPNAANTCLACVRASTDICQPIPRSLVLQHCRQCDRYLQPPQHWLAAPWESRELLAFILRRLKPALSKLRLVDAHFLWTEPHSRRIQVQLAVQAAVQGGLILQQECTVECIQAGQQCTDCARVNAKNMWMAAVQVRQKVPHKRTFLYLEQVILKRQAHAQVTNIKSRPDGLDFYFSQRNHALRFVHFLETVVPLQCKASEQLISQDIQGGTSFYKFTYSVDIVPACKDDLVVLPKTLSRAMGGAGPLLLCCKVGTSVHLVNPFFDGPQSMLDVSASQFYRAPFSALFSATSKNLVEYYVLDIEVKHANNDDHHPHNKFLWADAVVAKVSDYGAATAGGVHARTHLGHVLKCGDIVLGYDLRTANLNNDDLQQLIDQKGAEQLPEVVLVRKSYAHLRQQSSESVKKRKWKLRKLEMDVDDDQEDELTTQKDMNGSDDNDEERFMQDIEEDAELRAQIALYRQASPSSVISEDGSGVGNELDVPLEELLDDLDLSNDDE
jgi:nonsense-mediated mRNA decay protein 3